MMMRDERITNESQWVDSIALKILRWGIFAVWLLASLAAFVLQAVRGIPITYPVELTKKEQILFLLFAALVGSILPIVILLIMQRLESFSHGLEIFIRTSLILFLLFSIYKAIVHRWEKKHLE